MPILGPGKPLSETQYQAVRDALHIITGVVLFEFAREPRGTRDFILRNLVARVDRLTAAVFALWALRDYQDCWILHRCLLERYFHLAHLADTDGFETFEAWSFLEQYKAVSRVLSDSNVDTNEGDHFVPPSSDQKERAKELLKCPPQWRRPRAKDVAKGRNVQFLYTYGYDHASARVHPMADDGLQDFHLITGLEPSPSFPEQSTVLANTLLVNSMVIQDAMNASTMSWMALVFHALDDVRQYLASGEGDFAVRVGLLADAFGRDDGLSQPGPQSHSG